MKVGNMIKELRLKKGLKQKELADKLDITQGYLSQIESGHKNPSTELIQLISKRLNTSITIMLFNSIEEYDVAEDKRELFRMLNPAISSLINSFA